MPKQYFSELPLSDSMLKNLLTLGYKTMTPIQEQSLPLLLEGKDVIAKAQTGSGKTAAFGIRLLDQLDVGRLQPQSLVLCPTRELAQQVATEIRRIARSTHNVKVLLLCGGMPLGPQIGSLEYGAHIIVGTPGRVQKHLDIKTLHLRHIKNLVLDEADRMLDMGFIEQIESIIETCPLDRQTLLFSATYPQDIQKLSESFQRDPIFIDTEEEKNDILQVVYEVQSSEEKSSLLRRMLLHFQPQSSLVFCNTKQETTILAEELQDAGISALAINGDLEQRERNEVLIRFGNKSCSVLMATDVAARGLDIKDLDMVVIYETSIDPEVHIHRIGRTGRAGKKGLALTIVAPEEEHRLKRIEQYIGSTLTRASTSELLESNQLELKPEMVTFCIDGGRKQKVRPGDILGSLTKDAGFQSKDIGKIDIADHHSYVAIHHSIARKAYQHLRKGKIKGRFFKVRVLS